MPEPFALDHGPDVVPLFVYGTLRKGGTLHGWLSDVVVDSEDAIAAGFSLRTVGPFPLMVHEAGQVTYGEVLWVRRGRQLQTTIDMEVASGYVVEFVDVECESVNMPLPVLSFVWSGGISALPRVPANDWMAT